MLALLHRGAQYPSIVRPCLRAQLAIAARRGLSTTSVRLSADTPEPPTPEEQAELEAASPEPVLAEEDAGEQSEEVLEDEVQEEVEERRSWEPRSYREFLTTIGGRFKVARPKNWLGGDVPFPMNPSFKPPPPLSDVLRQKIYNEFMADPKKNSVRILSQRYNLSLKRVDAILRLKGLEHAWHKGKQIQYGFQKGMEKLLGVQSWASGLQNESRWDVTEADSLEQDENRDAQRQRYQRHYWESVPEDGREPIVPASLEHAKNLAQRLVKFEERQKSTHPRLMPRFPDTDYIKSPKEKVRALQKPGRPALEVRDVGGYFLDLNERLKRISVAERRSREREKKRESRKRAISARQV